MQERLTIARPYARAAFEQAREAGELERWSAALALLAAVVGHEDMRRLIGDPRVRKATLERLLLDIGGERFDGAIERFVRLLTRAGRLPLAPEIARLFEESRAEAQALLDVELTSAFELSAEQEQKIVEAIKRHLRREVRVASRVDPEIIGGAVVRIGDRVIDGSVKGRLRELATALA